MADTIELLRIYIYIYTTYNALIVEQWLREGNREESMRCICEEKSDRERRIYARTVQSEEKGKPSIDTEATDFVP